MYESVIDHVALWLANDPAPGPDDSRYYKRCRYDAETLVGFYCYFDFDLEQIVPLFVYSPATLKRIWKFLDRWFSEGRGGAGLPSRRPIGPIRWAGAEATFPITDD